MTARKKQRALARLADFVLPAPSEAIRMTRLEAALDAAGRGYPVFELKPKAKVPRFSGWQNAATTDAAAISKWWTTRPSSNIGVALDARQYVLDIDNAAAMAAVDAMNLPRTLKVRSGREAGGFHLYFAVENGAVLRNRTRVCGIDGLEGKTAGKLVAWAGSLHASGAVYAIEDDVPAVPLPAWLAERIGERSEVVNAEALTATDLVYIADIVSRRTSARTEAMRGDGLAAFTAAHDALAAELPMIQVGWADAFFKHAHKVGRYVGAGVLGFDEVIDALDHVAGCHGVAGRDGHHVFRSIRRGVTAGAREVYS